MCIRDRALMWRGPSWPTTNWYVLEGLLNAMSSTIDPTATLSVANAVQCAIRAKKAFLGYSCTDEGDMAATQRNATSMINQCENGVLNDASDITCDRNFCSSAHMIKSLLQQWVALTSVSGYSEYYNPITGQPLGQRGLGMSFSLLEVLQRTFGEDGETFGREALGDEQRFRTPKDVGAALARDIRQHVLDEARSVLGGCLLYTSPSPRDS
eukprot:TRINITY_DN13854_c0_g1_i2.p1 TRINITY_DN13854_c0_g1~~TRINITY_DN13854_c0_g1_i2.p1  ORF type:complete len:211 (-),score=31.25 TRINITY_DN13854_c0_g1_i2:92-724(-)